MSLINDMLHDLARRDRSQPRPLHDARAYDPLPRAHPLPTAAGLDSRHWWRPLLWLNLLLITALVALGGAWWLQTRAGWPSALPAHEPPMAVAIPAAETGEPHTPPATDVPGSAVMPEPVAAPSIDSITLSGIATAPALQRPLVATRPEAGASDHVPTSSSQNAATAAVTARTTTAAPVRARAPIPAPAPPSSPRSATPPAATPLPSSPPSVGATAVGSTPPVPAQPVSERPTQASTPAPATAAASPAPSTPRPVLPAIQPAESDADWAEARLRQAQAERKQGASDAAIQTFKTLLARQPQHVAARLELAALLQERKQMAAAAELLSEGLMLLPRQTRFTLALAPLWMQAGQQADAMALLEQGSRHASPKDGPYHAYYASQLLRLKRPVLAQQHFELAVASDPGRGEWLLGLGLALQANGRTKEAIAALQRASASGQLAPQNKAMVEQAIARLQTGS